MTTILDDFTDANGEPVQPYFVAYMLELGVKTAKEAFGKNGIAYMEWNRARWNECGKALGFKPEDSAFHRDDFHKWLSHRALDHLARQHVEAA